MSKIIMLGNGCHASVVEDILNQNGESIYAVSTKKNKSSQSTHKEIDEDKINELNVDDVLLANGIGFMPGNIIREKVFNNFKDNQFSFLKIISNNATLSSLASIGEGVHIFPGAIINANAKIGVNTIVNSAAVIEHDAIIGDHSHICPGTIICGGVRIGKSSFIGAGSCIIQNIEIGNNVVIPAGSIVKKNIYN